MELVKVFNAWNTVMSWSSSREPRTYLVQQSARTDILIRYIRSLMYSTSKAVARMARIASIGTSDTEPEAGAIIHLR